MAYVIGIYTYASFIPGIIKENSAREQQCKEWVDKKMAHMSLKERVGQLFIYTLSPYNTKSNKKLLQTAVDDYKVGGLLFSGGQLTNQAQLTNYAQEMAETPLFIAFDGEWGLAMRLKNMPSFPKNRVLGSIQDNDLIYQYGKEVARQCREIGVHINFAPVADIDNNPKNPVINTRSFGGDPDNVASKVIAYSKGLEEGGVLSVAKHFPGHGDTEVDSHKSLPVLTFNKNRLDSVEFVPFRRAVEAGIGGMMVGHLEVPALGEGAASLSRPVVDVLRNEMKFEGLIFSDALDMNGVSRIQNICSKALIAGNDILLAPKNLKRSMEDVLSAIKRGELTEEQIDEKCRKVLTYKFYLGLDKPQHIRMAGLEKRVHTEKTDTLISDLYKASITVIGNDNRAIPLDVNSSDNAFIIIGKESGADKLYSELGNSMPIEKYIAGYDSLQSIDRRILSAHKIVIAVTSMSELPIYKGWIEKQGKEKSIILVYLVPIKSYDSQKELWKATSAVVLGNSNIGKVQEHIARVILGKGMANGRLSVAAGAHFNPGDGVEIKDGMHTVYRPESYGMNSKILARIDSVAVEGIKERAYPGCQIVILKDGMPVYDKAFGTFSYSDTTKVTTNNLFDIASLSKSTATLLAVMKLYDEGKFGLTDKISQYVPALKGGDKERIIIEELLLHQSGLLPSLPFYLDAIEKSSYKGAFIKVKKDKHHQFQVGKSEYSPVSFIYKPEYISTVYSLDYPLQIADSLYASLSFKDVMMKHIATSSLRERKYVYSCINFVLLKEMVENITKMPLDEYLAKTFYEPMRLDRICFNPLKHFKKSDIVPTVEKDMLRHSAMPLQGFVHDEIAAFMGGVSGNAGLFANAIDVANVYQMIINEGEFQGKRYISKMTCDLFLKYKSRISRRGLGFDKPDTENPLKSPCAAEAPSSVVGHTGFTGTCAWADPDNRLVFVFLSNRINPQPYTQHKFTELNIRPRIQKLMYQSFMK